MKLLSSLAPAMLCAVAVAQSPFVYNPVAPVGYYGWNSPPPITTVMMNLTVTNQVTLQAIATPLLSPVGQQGTLEIYLTNPGITTYVGNELIAANWSPAASGQIIGKGTTGTLAGLEATSCQAVLGSGLTLNPGSYGIAFRYVGVTPLLAAVGVQQTIANADLSMVGGALQYTPWGALSGAPTAAGYNSWAWRGQFIYQPGVFPHACAESSLYGAGCYKVSGSCYQEWTDSTPGGAAPAAATALNTRQLTWVYTGAGYTMIPGTGAYLAPSGTAVSLPATDDGEAAITLTTPFPHLTGAAAQLFVHSNGYVSLGTNNTLNNGNLNYVPEPNGLLTATNTAWWCWHDYNPTEAGSGLIVWEEIGGIVYITWNGVESYPTTAVNPSTMQFQFDTSTGNVTCIYQSMTNIGGSGFLQGDDTIVGYSPGGDSPDAGPFDITTLTSINLPAAEAFPLQLNMTARPIIGTTVNLDTTRETGLSLGVNFVSVVQIPAPGFDLGILGMPGCAALVDINAGVGNVISNLGLPGLSMSVAFPLPNNPAFAGLTIHSQSVWLDPAANAFGALVSNGLTMVLGNF
ncbi:MAG: hypothetical protein JNK15_04000 [Planctomycetes bacterium]|nr:hypothetical protein [Planctomycetota bacterium]